MEEDYTVKNNLAQNLFWLGFIVYITSYAASSSNQFNYVLINVLQIIGLGLLIPSAAALIQFKIENGYLRIIFIIFLFWTMLVIIRGLKFDYDFVKMMLFSPGRGLFLHLVPLILLFPKQISFYKKMVNVLLILGVFFLIFSLIFIRDIINPTNYYHSQGIVENFSQHLSLSLGFVLLTFVYYSKSRNLFSLFVITMTFLFAVLRARRGLMFLSFTMLFFSYLVYQYANKTKIINVVISGFFILIVFYTSLNVYEKNRKDTFSLINERIGDDTRSEVEQYFIRDFEPKDWIIGRGLDGQYFCPGVFDGERVSVYRGVIETGFLQIILHGGIIHLLLLLLITIPALLKGLFHSKNLFSRAAGIWIVLFFLYAYPGDPTIFSMNYILVWISVGICYSEKIRSMSDVDIFKIIKNDQNNKARM